MGGIYRSLHPRQHCHILFYWSSVTLRSSAASCWSMGRCCHLLRGLTRLREDKMCHFGSRVSYRERDRAADPPRGSSHHLLPGLSQNVPAVAAAAAGPQCSWINLRQVRPNRKLQVVAWKIRAQKLHLVLNGKICCFFFLF